jgi:hypothetical protein
MTPDDKFIIVERFKRLDAWVSIGLENGLFKDNDKYTEIKKDIKEIWEGLEKVEYKRSEAEIKLKEIREKYFDAVESKNFWWKFQYVYAFPIFIYNVLFLLAIFFLYYLGINEKMSSILQINSLPINAVIWGTIGGILRSLWKLWNNLDDRIYRSAWLINFLSAPILGAILGGLVFFIVSSGAVILTASSVTTGNNENGLNSSLIIVLSALGGYNWEWAIEQLEKLKKHEDIKLSK